MSAFDPATFLAATFDTPSVRRPPIAVGEYMGIFGAPEYRPWVSKSDSTKSGAAVDYMIELDIPEEERTRIGLEQPTLKVKHGIMLDTTPTGDLDRSKGKNGGIRILREALDMNKPGDTFNLTSPQGRPVKVKISHREYPEGSGEFFEEVVGLVRA